MNDLEKINEAVLDKVKAEAASIVKDAEIKAAETIDKAKKHKQSVLLEEKSKIIGEANGEAARILAQASLKARSQLLVAKTEVVNEVISRAKTLLANFSPDKDSFLNLVRESINTLAVDKVMVYVSHRDLEFSQKIFHEDKELAGKIVETVGTHQMGGVIVEDIGGKIRIDNTYETRLEMLVPRLLPEINKKLFLSA